MSTGVTGALLGLIVAGGLWLIANRLAATRRPNLAARVTPHLVRQQIPGPEPSRGPLSTLLTLAHPRLMVLTGTSMATVADRLQRAGRAPDVDRHRLEQVAAAALGIVAGVGLGVIVVLRGGPLLGLTVLCGVGGVLGVLLHDRHLSAAGRKRQQRIGQQLPTVAELLAFAVAAGESPSVALQRVSTTVHGDLADEIGTAVIDMRSGMPLEAALRGVANRCGSSDVERFIDGVLISIERGTPLVEVLRAQAADARALERRRLMEVAGRKDVAMLLPVVFFILPTIIAIALFPGYRNIQGLIN